MKPRQLQGPPRKTLELRIKKLRGKKWSVIVAKLKEFCKIEGAYFLLPAQDEKIIPYKVSLDEVAALLAKSIWT